VERAVNIVECLASKAETSGGDWVEELDDQVVYLGRRNGEEEASFILKELTFCGDSKSQI